MAVTIEFGGKTRELFYGLREVRDLERELGGIPIGAIMTQLGQLSITAMSAALYVAMREDDKSLNVNLIVKMLDDYVRPISRGGQNRKIKVIADALSEALDETGLFKSADDPEGADEKNDRGRTRKPSPSGSSGRNPSASGSSD